MYLIKGIKHLRCVGVWDMPDGKAMAAMDLEDLILAKSRPCRYCKNLFIPNAPGQKVCKRPECQRARKNEKARNYKRRKKSNTNPA